MKTGISIFPGQGIKISEYIKYMEYAKEKGVDIVFTSMHIPESNENMKHEFEQILQKTNDLELKLVVDVSKRYLTSDLLNKYTFHALRLDFGFTDNEIIELSKKQNFKIYLNASTIDEEWFNTLMDKGLNSSNLEVSHNYYPKEETGLSKELFQKRNKFFKKLNIKISAFIPSHNKPRGPIYKGLPTLEEHRNKNIKNSIVELLEWGVDDVWMGDLLATNEEIDILTSTHEYSVLEKNININNKTTDKIKLFIEDIQEGYEYVLNREFKNRQDPANNQIRVEKDYSITNIQPHNTIKRYAGSLTIDNSKYLRYEGDLQITLNDFPKDKRINVVAKLTNESLDIARNTPPGQKIIFLEKEQWKHQKI